MDRLETQLKNLGIHESQLPPEPVLLKKGVSCPTNQERGCHEVHVQPPTGNVKQLMDKKNDLSGFEGVGTLQLMFQFTSGEQEVRNSEALL